MKKAPPGARLGNCESQLVLALRENLRENPPGGPAERPAQLPSRRTATGTVLRLCAPPLPRICFAAGRDPAEIAQGLLEFADRCAADARRLPAPPIALLQMARLARLLARQVREGRLP